MVDINSTISLIEPLSSTVGTLMDIIKILVGGFFGLYVVILIYKIAAHRKLSRKMDILLDEIAEIKVKLEGIEKKIGRKKKK